MNTKANFKTLGSEAYIQLTAFVTKDAVYKGCICSCGIYI